MLKQLWTILLDLIYPPKCPGCRCRVDVHGSWCSDCLRDVFAVREISVSLHHLKYLDYCLAACNYSGGVKRLIHAIKYRHDVQHIRHLEWLLETAITPGLLSPPDIVMAVPLHPERQRERGYNQAELIFKDWAESKGWHWCSGNLERTRATIPQWKLNQSERRQNIKDAFKLNNPEEVRSKSVLIVDDIITSGITINECAKVLKKAGASRVSGLALASGAPN